jgi:putative flippase GtrA
MTRPPATADTLRQFASFVIAGGLGFVVDVGVLYGALALGAGLIFGRLLSFVAAATATWLFNRRYTFSATGNAWREWLRYMSVMLVGMLVNFSAYSLALWLVQGDWWWRPAMAVAVGSAAGLFVNFANAKLFVYKS